MGKYFTIGIQFDKNLDINSALPFLLNVIFKEFFIPISVKYQIRYTNTPDEELSGTLGIDPSLIKYNNELLPDEELVEEIALTKYNGTVCLDELASLLREKISKFRFDVVGIANILYEEKSVIREGWFFREYAEYKDEDGVLRGYLAPLFEIAIYTVGMSVYTASYIFLKETANVRSNLESADQNLQRLCERLLLFSSEFPQISETDFSLKGSRFWNEFDRLREKIKVLPKFADSEYKFMQSKKK